MKRPWEFLITPELKQEEGPYADFAAWQIWVENDLSDCELSATDEAFIYSLCCRAIDDFYQSLTYNDI